MDVIFPIIFLAITSALIIVVIQNVILSRRKKFINDYKFPQTIRENVSKAYPHLTKVELDRVMRGLRDYFHLIAQSRRKMIAMPSQVVDVAWHEFILFTRRYDQFCAKALGHFLHHTPAEAMKSQVHAQDGIKRAWRIACHLENINPHKPSRLPAIFALDAALNIQDGFHYELDCMKLASSNSGGGSGASGYCGSHIGCSSGCAGSAGDGGCAGDGGGGGGGCGGN